MGKSCDYRGDGPLTRIWGKLQCVLLGVAVRSSGEGGCVCAPESLEGRVCPGRLSFLSHLPNSTRSVI